MDTAVATPVALDLSAARTEEVVRLLLRATSCRLKDFDEGAVGSTEEWRHVVELPSRISPAAVRRLARRLHRWVEPPTMAAFAARLAVELHGLAHHRPRRSHRDICRACDELIPSAVHYVLHEVWRLERSDVGHPISGLYCRHQDRVEDLILQTWPTSDQLAPIETLCATRRVEPWTLRPETVSAVAAIQACERRLRPAASRSRKRSIRLAVRSLLRRRRGVGVAPLSLLLALSDHDYHAPALIEVQRRIARTRRCTHVGQNRSSREWTRQNNIAAGVVSTRDDKHETVPIPSGDQEQNLYRRILLALGRTRGRHRSERVT